MVGRIVPGARDLAGAGGADAGRVVADGVDPGVAARVQFPHVVGEDGDAGLIELGVFLVVDADAAVEQQLVGVRARPVGDVDKAGRRDLDGRGFRRDVRGNPPVVAVFVLVVVI